MHARSTAAKGVRTAAAAAAVLLAGAAQGQLVAGYASSGNPPVTVYDTLTGQWVLSFSQGLRPVRALTADDAARVLYFSTGTQLWRIPYDEPRTPVLVGAYSGAITNINGGLAWDSARQELYGTGVGSPQLGTVSNALVRINPNNAQVTLLRMMDLSDFGGLDYDAANDRLLGLNDSPTINENWQGLGIYSIAPPYATGAIGFIAPSPEIQEGVQDNDIDGLAVGQGRVYLVTDNRQWLYRYDLSTGQYLQAVAQPHVPESSSIPSCGAAWAPGLTAGLNYDLSVSLELPAPCAAVVGGVAQVVVHAQNIGPADATGVTVRTVVSGPGLIAGSVPAGAHTPQGYEVGLGSLQGLATVPITLDVLVQEGGEVSIASQVLLVQNDPDAANNSVSGAFSAAAPPAAARTHSAVLSTVPTAASSAAPGLSGVRISSIDRPLGRPSRSESGTRWAIVVDSDAAGSEDGLIITGEESPDGAGAIFTAAREGHFPLLAMSGGTFPPRIIDDGVSINDAGVLGFGGVDARLNTNNDAFIARVQGGVAEVVAQEGETAFAALGPNVLMGALRGGVHVAPSGQMAFACSLSGAGVGPASDTAIFKQDGAFPMAQEGVSIPFGQLDENGWQIFSTIRALEPATLTAFGEGDTYCIGATLNLSFTFPPPGGIDQALLGGSFFGDPVVLVQENVTPAWAGLPDRARDGAPFTHARVDPPGVRLVVGSNNNGQDWVQRDGITVAQTGWQAVAETGEAWSDSRVPDGFLFAGQNGAGALVLTGHTDAADPLSDWVLTIDGVVLLRGNDACDVTGDGVPDGLRIRSLLPGRAFVGEHAVYAVVGLRTDAAAAGCGPDVEVAQALIRVPLGAGDGCGPCAADYNRDDAVDDLDISAFFAGFEQGDACADTNRDEGVDDLDISAFFVAFEQGC